MKIPVEYANKVLWLLNHIQTSKYMYGSKKYGWITYEISEPKIILEKSKNYLILSCELEPCIIDIQIITDYLKHGALWNNTTFSSPYLLPDTKYDFTATYLGNLEYFLEAVTYLWFVDQN